MGIFHLDSGNLRAAAAPLALLLLWLLLISLSLGMLLQGERSRIERAFDASFTELTREIETQLLQNELALEAFRGFLTAQPDFDFERIRVFSRTLLRIYPNIYMFEIAQRIPEHGRPALEQRMRDAGYPQFTIHEFGYDSDRQVHVSGPQSSYQPIIFMEPETTETRDVLGLDLNSTSGALGEAARQSYGSLREVSSLPFDLIEGGRGYIIYGPVVTTNGTPEDELQSNGGLFALVVVRTHSLLPAWLADRPDLHVALRHRAGSTAQDSQLIASGNPAARTAMADPSRLFGPLRRQAHVSSRSQPFELTAEWAPGWEDIDLGTLSNFVITLLVTLLLTGWASVIVFRRRRLAASQRQALYERANFDATTGLPNKHLLEDRVNQAIKQARRRKGLLALLFIDLDGFKGVNDRWGHTMGDAVLRQVAARIAAAVREEDTVSRIHGDEFLVLLSEVEDRASTDAVVDKLARLLDTPLPIDGHRITLSLSIGAALFPEDGGDFGELLQCSDRRMYAMKQQNRGSHRD